MEKQIKPCPFCGCIPEVKGDVVTHRHKDDICIVDDTQYDFEKWNKRADGWISVEDRLPEDSSDVLVFDSEEGMKTAEYELNTFSVSENFNTTYRYLNNVTHWMPLPGALK